MAAIYHLADDGNGRIYARISVDDAGVPTLAAQNTIQADALGRKVSIFSTDGGTTLWCGGDSWPADPPKAGTMHVSIDGGATWTNKYDKFPDHGANPGATEVLALAGVAGDVRLVCSTQGPGLTDRFDRYNDGTDLWDAKADVGVSSRPNSMWWREDTAEVYTTENTGLYGKNLYRSSDGGETWAADATYAAVAGPSPRQIFVEADGTITTLNQDGAGLIPCRGTWGGPWTNDATIVGSSHGEKLGRVLGVDETGEVWASIIVGGQQQVHRRNPGSGLWTVSQALGGAGGGLWVVDSSNILASILGFIWTWNGTAWNSYTNAALGLVAGSAFPAIWAAAPAACSAEIIDSQVLPVGSDFVINNAQRLPTEFQTEAGCRTFVVPFSYNTPGRIIRNRITAPSSSGNSCVMPHTVVKTKREKEE